jgi:ribosomal protein S12 methylthiotransferase accessory factor
LEMLINFPGGKRVTSTDKGFSVATDQPPSEGGDGSAPEPVDLFLSSIGTCAGVYIVYFCESRDSRGGDVHGETHLDASAGNSCVDQW